MAIPYDLFNLSGAGIDFYAGEFGKEDDFILSHIVQDEDDNEILVVTNLTQFEAKREPSKPRIFNRNKFSSLFNYKTDDDGYALSFIEPNIWLLSDHELSLKYSKTKQRRDDAFKLIEPFTTPEKIYQYLAGKLNKEIKAHAETLGCNPNNNGKEIIRPLNRFISLGCHKNALILVKYENCGKEPRSFKADSKTGPKTKSCGNPTNSVSRMYQPDDIQKIRGIAFANGIEKKDGKFQIKRIRTLFDREHASDKGWVVKNDKQFPALLLNENQRLTKRQFYRVFHKAIMPNEMMVLTDGVKEAINRSRQTKGKANEGIFRAAQVCEIDTTPLPVYLANPLEPNKRETVGKVYLCMIVCVATQMIMGYSLSFAPPVWENIAEAIINCMLNKQEYALNYGVDIDPEDWPVQIVPEGLRADNGVEYLKQIIQRVINGDEIEINDFSINAPGQPRGKGTSEKILHIMEGFLENLQGKVTKGRNPSIQHPANHPIIFLEGLHALVIRAITIHNTTHFRPRLITHEMAFNSVKPVPSAMWQYLINHEAYGRPPTSPQQLSQKVWVLMRKHTATVNPREIRLNKLGYKNQWAIKQGWFDQAEFHGAFDLEVIAFKGCVDQIYVRDDVGVLYPIEIHDDYEKFRGMTLSQAQAEQHKDAQIKQDLEHQNAQALINYETEVQTLVAQGEDFYQYTSVNCRISIPDGIDVLNFQMRENEQIERADRHLKLMGVASDVSKTNIENQSTGTNDDEEYIC
jgi:putative transposase